jgi:hypothetical protein
VWGDRLYLSTTDEDELQDFCGEILTPRRRRRHGDLYGSLLRASDRHKPQTGLPHLPPDVWIRFLASEASLQNEEGSLRLALDSILARVRVESWPIGGGPDE